MLSIVVVIATSQYNQRLEMSVGGWFGLVGADSLPVLKKAIWRISSCNFTRRGLFW